MTIRKVIKNGVIKYVRVKEDNSESPIEEDHKDKEIARLSALVDKLTKELEKEPKEEAPSSDVMAVAAASTYSCYS